MGTQFCVFTAGLAAGREKNTWMIRQTLMQKLEEKFVFVVTIVG